jgi:hypothetical protein
MVPSAGFKPTAMRSQALQSTHWSTRCCDIRYPVYIKYVFVTNQVYIYPGL